MSLEGLDGILRAPEVAFHPRHFHGLHHHSRQPEGHPLGELFAIHGGLKAVAKVDVQQLAAVAVQHQVAGVPVAQAQQIAHHGHDSSGAGVVCAPLQPHLAAARLEPQHLVQVLAYKNTAILSNNLSDIREEVYQQMLPKAELNSRLKVCNRLTWAGLNCNQLKAC